MLDPQKLHLLQVRAHQRGGVLLDDGQMGSIFMPGFEIYHSLRVGQEVVVALFADPEGQILASMKLNKWIQDSGGPYQEGQAVSLLIVDATDLGFKAVIEDRHWGVLYQSDVHKWLRYGERVQGYIRKIREDGKYDLTLQQAGHKAAQSEIGPLILQALEEAGGFLDLTDKTDPTRIAQMFGVSKKKYKIALGGLYKQQRIIVEKEGIRLVKRKS